MSEKIIGYFCNSILSSTDPICRNFSVLKTRKLSFTCKISKQHNDDIFSNLFKKTGYDISCKR